MTPSTKPEPETRREQLRNIGTRAAGVQNFNAFVRKGETREEAMESIAKAAEELADGQ